MDAHNLFEYEGCSTALARKNDPQTSKDAAEKMVKSGTLNRQEKMVYNAIVRYIHYNVLSVTVRGFTTKDIAVFISQFSQDMSYDKAYDICRKRFSGLRDKGKIVLVFEGLDIKRRDACQVWELI